MSPGCSVTSDDAYSISSAEPFKVGTFVIGNTPAHRHILTHLRDAWDRERLVRAMRDRGYGLQVLLITPRRLRLRGGRSLSWRLRFNRVRQIAEPYLLQ